MNKARELIERMLNEESIEEEGKIESKIFKHLQDSHIALGKAMGLLQDEKDGHLHDEQVAVNRILVPLSKLVDEFWDKHQKE